MKNKLLGLVLVNVLLGCGESPKEPEVRIKYAKGYASSPVYKFDFENHQYISFDNGTAKSIVHNPECLNQKCKK